MHSQNLTEEFGANIEDTVEEKEEGTSGWEKRVQRCKTYNPDWKREPCGWGHGPRSGVRRSHVSHLGVDTICELWKQPES